MSSEQIVNLDEQARTAVSLGESHFREFKSVLHGPPSKKVTRDKKSIARDIAEALVAFANADGGELLIGVEDDGTISGVGDLSGNDIEYLIGAPRTHVHIKTPLSPVRTAKVALDGYPVLYFSGLRGNEWINPGLSQV